MVLVETHTWEEVEGAIWQSVRRTSEGAMGYALAVLDRIRTDVEEQFRFQTRALQTGRQEGLEFGRNKQLQDLLGPTHDTCGSETLLCSCRSVHSQRSEKN